MRDRSTIARLGLAVFMLMVLAAPLPASGHVERPSYFPDPAAERVGGVKTGGKVPRARSLASALKAKPAGETRVVCRDNSLRLLRRSVREARKRGFDIRPTDHRELSADLELAAVVVQHQSIVRGET